MITDDSRIVHVDVEPGDPHNDQMAARARHDLRRHVTSARNTLAAARGDSATAMAVVTTVLADEQETFPRDRLAAMLAAALVELASSEVPPYAVLSLPTEEAEE